MFGSTLIIDASFFAIKVEPTTLIVAGLIKPCLSFRVFTMKVLPSRTREA